MQINTYVNELVTENITKSYADFNTSNPLPLIQLTTGNAIVGIDVKIINHFTGPSNSESKLNIPNLIENLNITNGKQAEDSESYIDLLSTPYFVSASAWSTESNFSSTAKSKLFPCSGTQNSALASGGWNGVGVGVMTEEYDGTNWSLVSGGNLNVGRWGTYGCGTQTAALTFGGNSASSSTTTIMTTEEYNGATWSFGGSLSIARYFLTGCGTQTAGLCFGGLHSSTDYNTTEEYDGTTWTVGGALLAGSYKYGAFGIQTSALAFNGWSYNSGIMATQEYDGTSWTVSTPSNIIAHYSSGAGTQSLGLKIGGVKPNQYLASPTGSTYISQCETFDGNSWSMGSDLNTIRGYAGAAGSQAESLAFGGENLTGVLSSTESHTTAGFDSSIKNILCNLTNVGLKAWEIAKDLNVSRYGTASFGTQDAGLNFGGALADSTATSTAEEYDGTSWTITSSISTARLDSAGAGTQTAGLAIGGTAYSVITQHYNGSGWTSGGNLNTGKHNLSGCGTQTAAVCFTGSNSTLSYTNTSEEYNGTTWTSGGLLGVSSYNSAGCGTQTASLAIAGFISGGQTERTEEYNGTSWASGGALNEAKYALGSCGLQSSAICFAGGTNTTTTSNSSEEYDGSTWSISKNLNIDKRRVSGCGTSSNGLCVGGFNEEAGVIGSVEEFNSKTPGSEDWVSGSLQFTIKYINYSG